MAEEELQNQLDKLEIGPALPQIKFIDQNQIPIVLNPFYDESIKDNLLISGGKRSEIIFYPETTTHDTSTSIRRKNCICRIRRRSESVLDDSKSTAGQSMTPVRAKQHERTIKNGMLFKKTASNSTGSINSGARKIVLREPILRALQKCLHPSGAIRKKHQLTDSVKEDMPRSECPTIEALNLDDSISLLKVNELNLSTPCAGVSKLSQSRRRRERISDFRDLMAECQNLLETSVSFKYNWSSSNIRRNSKNFNTMRLSDPLPLRQRDDGSYNMNNINLQINQTPINDRDERLSRSAPNSASGGRTSCSQQARVNLTASNDNTVHSQSLQPPSSSSGCDVTIDELASYFETFVHIPKKMSKMAEMMYI